MRFFLLIVSLFGFKTYACGQNIDEAFHAFAIKNQNENSYIVFFPDNDFSETPMYLSGISASQANVFSFELEYFVSKSHPGYFQTQVSASPELLTHIQIIASYSFTNKARTNLALCANWKAFTLKQLLANTVGNV